VIIVNVQSDISGVLKKLEDLGKEQVPFATALAMTRTAQYAQQALAAEMSRVFDRPTPRTLNSTYVRPATKAVPIAQVKIKDEGPSGIGPVKWLLPEIQGGSRSLKGFERLLERAGILPSGWWVIPAQGANLDAYGNVSGGTITKILAQLQALRDELDNEKRDVRAKRDRTRKQGRYFAVIPDRPPSNHLKPGIYERMGTTKAARLLPIFTFTSKAPRYGRRYDFYAVGERASRERFPIEFEAAVRVTAATAR
jgi:hypothetical protein